MFFDIISILDEIYTKNSTDLFVKFFCDFFDIPGVPGGAFWSTGEILPSLLDVGSSFEVLTMDPIFSRIN